MARKPVHVVVGIFVVFGSLIAAALIIWVGASRYFEQGSRYLTYFDESVQGLQKDSPVKYRGVEVGRVEEIRVAPDNRLIEVLMKINLAEGVRSNLIAELKSVGITGIVFVDLGRLETGETPKTPALTFKPAYPVIPSRSSAITEVLTKAEQVVEKISKVDFEGVSDQLKNTGKSAERLFEGAGTRRMVENLERLSYRLDQFAARLDNVYSNERLTRIAAAAEADVESLGRLIAKVEAEMDHAKVGDRSAEAKALIAESRALIADARSAVAGAGMAVAETGQSAARITESFEEQQRTLLPAARESVDELRRTSTELRELVKQLKDSPSELLFSNPPPHRK